MYTFIYFTKNNSYHAKKYYNTMLNAVNAAYKLMEKDNEITDIHIIKEDGSNNIVKLTLSKYE